MLASWKENYDKPRQCIKKNKKKKTKKHKDIPVPTKVRMVKVVFHVVMNGCESWTVKKVDSQELMTSNFGSGEDS